jgi:hypothetical protein
LVLETAAPFHLREEKVMNHRIVLPFVCGLALLAAACDRPAPNNSSDAAQPSTLPAPSPSPDPAVDPATPQAIPVPEGTPGSTTDGTTPVTPASPPGG